MLSPIETLAENVRNLEREIQALWNKVHSLKLPKINGMEYKSLVFDEFPCTAAVEVQLEKLEKLATYFDRRARENAKRAEKLEGKLTTFTSLVDIVKSERGAYYFSGKEDSYKNAAQKVRDLLAHKKPEVWIVEFATGKVSEEGRKYYRSSSLPKEYSDSEEAYSDIRDLCKKTSTMKVFDYRVVRK